MPGVDFPFVLANGDRHAGQSSQPVTLYLTVIVSPNITSSASYFQSTEVNEQPLREATSPIAQDVTNISRLTVATGSLSPSTGRLGRTPMSPATDRQAGRSPVENALHDAKEVMTTNNLSKTWEGALARIKWVMDTLSPLAEVRCNVVFADS